MIEKEMGNRGSKSVTLKSAIVKEQRVDGNCCFTWKQLRCTLMGFERNYQIKIPSNQINKRMFYSTSGACETKPQMELDLLNPYFGFIDASSKKENKALVVWATNLSSTVGVRFTRSQLSLVKLPLYIHSTMVGLILSDAWLILENKTCKNALLGFSQSGANTIYAWYVFSILSHYCTRYPIYRIRKYKGKFSYTIQFKTRSMPCITELKSLFYP